MKSAGNEKFISVREIEEEYQLCKLECITVFR